MIAWWGKGKKPLSPTNWGPNNMADILLTTFSIAFSWLKIFVFWSYHWWMDCICLTWHTSFSHPTEVDISHSCFHSLNKSIKHDYIVKYNTTDFFSFIYIYFTDFFHMLHILHCFSLHMYYTFWNLYLQMMVPFSETAELKRISVERFNSWTFHHGKGQHGNGQSPGVH